MENTEWWRLTHKLDWEYCYAGEKDIFPELHSGTPWLPAQEWSDWEEPYKTDYKDYVAVQHDKNASVAAIQNALGRVKHLQTLDPVWLNALKLHAAALPLAEFSAVVGNLRSARFARDSAWRHAAAYGALDECRHTQIPLAMMQEFVRLDPQFDWTHKFYHSNCWVAIAARRFFDELLLFSNPIEFAVATNFVFETGFTNLQFIGLAALSDEVGDHLFEEMLASIQTDEARHAQIGFPVLQKVARQDPKYAQYLVDKWFWRSWVLFGVLTGFAMDYLSPVARRQDSFKEFMQEWINKQFISSLERIGLAKPWYWSTFERSLDYYHHMVYASAYSYRASVWFNVVVPSPEARAWLASKYPTSWDSFEPIWANVDRKWEQCDAGVEFGVHGTSIVGFCHLCNIVLCQGTPEHNSACTLDYQGRRYIFCSEPCKWIFEREPERYAEHKDLVKRVLDGEAPGNLLDLLRNYCGLEYESWGKDVFQGQYPWLKKKERH